MNKEKIEKVLQKFSDYLEAEVKSVKVGGVKRKATLQDQIDFIKGCWQEASEELSELGIDTNY